MRSGTFYYVAMLENAATAAGLLVSAALGYVVIFVLARAGIRLVRQKRKQRISRKVPLDARHVSVAALAVSIFPAPFVADGVRWSICSVIGAVGLLLGSAFAYLSVPPRQECDRRAFWAPIATFSTLSVGFIAIALALRWHG